MTSQEAEFRYICQVVLRVFGLTGGIGSGKSAVARHWRARGLPVVNADELARTVVAPGSDALLCREITGPKPFRLFSPYLAGFARRPCHPALWSVAGPVKSLVNVHLLSDWSTTIFPRRKSSSAHAPHRTARGSLIR